MTRRTTRREFLRQGAALTGAATTAGVFGAPAILSHAAGGDRLGVAVIGVGGMGGYSMDCALRERVVALVDIQEDTLRNAEGRAKQGGHSPKTYHDYRKMYDECGKDLDVALIATPDHHHAPAALRAIKLGKAAFSQKPLSHNIYEAWTLARAAQDGKVLTQMGNQGHCGEAIRRVCEYIWSGAIGDVTETHSILGRNFGGTGGRPASKPVPGGVHWDEWLGPAPHRDYHDGLHPFGWRSWRQFGTGTIGDMACHNVDTLFWALKIAEAKGYAVEAVQTKGGSEEMYETDDVLRWDIPARGAMPPVKVYAYDHGELKPEVMKEAERKYKMQFGECTLFVGTKGMIRITGHSGEMQFLPKERIDEIPAPPQTIPRAHGGPIEDLFHCMKNGGTPCSNFPDAATPLTSFVLTGLLAMRAGAGKKLDWSVTEMKCTNAPEINAWVKREYRKGWEV